MRMRWYHYVILFLCAVMQYLVSTSHLARHESTLCLVSGFNAVLLSSVAILGVIDWMRD